MSLFTVSFVVSIAAILAPQPLLPASPPHIIGPALKFPLGVCEAAARSMNFLNAASRRAWIKTCKEQLEERLSVTDIGWGITSAYSSVAVGDGVVHLVYTGLASMDDLLNTEVYYLQSSDSGTTWLGTPMSTSPGIAQSPSLVVSGNLVYVVWADNREGNYEIYLRRSTDKGQTWSEAIRVTNAAGNSLGPSAILSNGRLHIVWNDDRDGNLEVYYRRGSPWESQGWDSETRITNTSSSSSMPSLAGDATTLHLVWKEDRHIAYTRSLDGGGQWATIRQLSHPYDRPRVRSEHPAVVVHNQRVNVFFMDNRASTCTEGCFRIWQVASASSGDSWGTERSILADESRSWQVRAAMDGEKVWLIYTATSTSGGSDSVMLLRSSDGGITWGERSAVARDTGGLWRASLSVSVGAPTIIHTTWTRGLPDSGRVFYAKRNDTP